jgi:hypothetical protein
MVLKEGIKIAYTQFNIQRLNCTSMLLTIPHMTTLTSVMEDLRLKNQDHEFMMTENGFTTNQQKFYQPEELTITRTYRFEGQSDPGDSVILYLIEANDGLIGYSLDSYGAYSNNPDGYDDFVKKITVKQTTN